MRRRTVPPLHPGELLAQHYLEPLGLRVTTVAHALGVSRKTLSKILHGRGAITPYMAMRLAHAFQTSPELWMNLQQQYDLWHAAQHAEAWEAITPLVPTPA